MCGCSESVCVGVLQWLCVCGHVCSVEKERPGAAVPSGFRTERVTGKTREEAVKGEEAVNSGSTLCKR